MSKQKLIAKTFAGLEDILAKELKAVGAENIKIMRRAVQFEGDSEVMYRANFSMQNCPRYFS